MAVYTEPRASEFHQDHNALVRVPATSFSELSGDWRCFPAAGTTPPRDREWSNNNVSLPKRTTQKKMGKSCSYRWVFSLFLSRRRVRCSPVTPLLPGHFLKYRRPPRDQIWRVQPCVWRSFICAVELMSLNFCRWNPNIFWLRNVARRSDRCSGVRVRKSGRPFFPCKTLERMRV